MALRKGGEPAPTGIEQRLYTPGMAIFRAVPRRSSPSDIRPFAVCIAVVGALAIISSGCGSDDTATGPAVTTSPTTTNPTTPTTGAPTTTGTPVDHRETDVVIESRNEVNSEVTVSLVEGASGAVLASVYQAATYSVWEGEPTSPVLDADLAPGGTVYLVVRSAVTEDSMMRPGGTTLLAVDIAGSRRTIKENVTDVELSPDGSLLAYAVMSPDGDGDGDGLGTSAIRVLDLGTDVVETLVSYEVPLSDSGEFTTESENWHVAAWTADGSSLIVESGCCDSGSVTVIPAEADAPVPLSDLASAPMAAGDYATYMVGFDPDGRVLVQRSAFTGDGFEVALAFSGIEIVALDPVSGEVTAPVYTEAKTEEPGPRYDLVGSTIPGTPSPQAIDALIDELPFDGDGIPTRAWS